MNRVLDRLKEERMFCIISLREYQMDIFFLFFLICVSIEGKKGDGVLCYLFSCDLQGYSFFDKKKCYQN